MKSIHELTGKTYNVDCMDFIKQLPDKCIDLICCDPPFGIQYKSNHYKDANPFNSIENDDILFMPINQLWRLIKDTGSLFFFFSYKNRHYDKRIKNEIIWVKNNWTAGDLYGDFGNQYETIAFCPKDDFKLRGRRFSNVWHFDRVPPKHHPTEKPISMIERIIESATDEGQIVYDPFGGSCVTAFAAMEMKRRWICTEIDKKYCDVANHRLAQESSQIKFDL